MNEQISPAEARKRMLRYNLQKSIDKSGDAMTVPGLLLGGITGAGIAARRGNLRGALAGAAIGAPLGMVGLRLAGRLEERQRLAGMLQPTEKKLSALNPALREFALVRDANGQLVEDGNGGGSGFKTAAKVGLGSAGAAGGAVLGTRWYHANKAIQAEGGIGKFYGDVKKMYAAGDSKGLQNLHERMSSNAQASARAGWMGKLGKVGNVLTKFSANLKPALRELAARSGRIVEFGDGGADEAVLGALKAVASADESSAQRAMLLKRGLIEMVAGQVVITERGYEMMQKAGMPPKLTPEERREEIAGTEEKRLSRFDHRGHGGHGVELARGDYAIPALKKILVGSQGMPVGEFNKVIPIFKGKFPKAAYGTGLFPSRTASSATRSEILQAITPIRKEAAQALRAARKRL